MKKYKLLIPGNSVLGPIVADEVARDTFLVDGERCHVDRADATLGQCGFFSDGCSLAGLFVKFEEVQG